MNSQKISIGVIGVGHLGQHHVKHYSNMDNINLLGVYDSDIVRGKKIANSYNTKYFEKANELMKKCDAISIVTPTESHYNVAKAAISNFNCNVFIEKPITETTIQADRLIEEAKKRGLIIQVGHIERLNPAVKVLDKYDLSPKFIDIQRLAPYTVRGTDVPVVLDLMIHDIDILLSLVKSRVKSIHASGVSILTNSIDIAHARILFENNCVCNLSSSRISDKVERKMRVFQKNEYYSLDYQNCILDSYKKVKKGSILGIEKTQDKFLDNDSLKEEIESFLNCISNKKKPIVNADDGINALQYALKISNIIKK